MQKNFRFAKRLVNFKFKVARYNSAAQHQTIQHAIVSPVLKSRTEVLRIIEQLSEKQYSEVADLILPVDFVFLCSSIIQFQNDENLHSLSCYSMLKYR